MRVLSVAVVSRARMSAWTSERKCSPNCCCVDPARRGGPAAGKEEIGEAFESIDAACQADATLRLGRVNLGQQPTWGVGADDLQLRLPESEMVAGQGPLDGRPFSKLRAAARAGCVKRVHAF